jgi:uncharacterized protein involved in high-affinity Fe2+ transport
MKRTIAAAIVAAGMFTAAAQAQTPANLPSGRDLLMKSLHATGADTVMPKHTSMTMTGTLSIPAAGISGPVVMHKSAAGQFHVQIDIEAAGGVIEQGYADGTAWSINPNTGATIVDGAGAQSARRQAVWMDSPDQYTTMTTVAMEKFAGKDAYKVDLTTKDGAKMTRWFDTTTGLSLGSTTSQDMGGQVIDVTTTISEYKNFGGLMFPTKQTQSIAGNDQEIAFEKIEFDNVKPEQLALPASIKAIKK